MLKDDGSLDALEHKLYTKWLAMLKTQAEATPLSAIIYVDTDPAMCAARIDKRGRQGEGGIPLDYLQSLDKYQREWIASTQVPVLRVGAFPNAQSVGDFVEKESKHIEKNTNIDDNNKENVSPKHISKLNSFSATTNDEAGRPPALDSN
jgi:deoxyadenosine/deoxycytidine kinase